MVAFRESCLLELGRFEVADTDSLTDAVQLVPWSEHLNVDSTFAIDVTLVESPLQHSHYAMQRVKDAIADQFRDESGTRPDVARERPDVRVHVHIAPYHSLHVSIDLSGESLHRRGYRQVQSQAPIKGENLAAAFAGPLSGRACRHRGTFGRSDVRIQNYSHRSGADGGGHRP
ncbi:MAG: THUMP domain-containing protein [Myxococcota bacterium]